MTDWGARAAALLGELAEFSGPGPGVTRLPFTPEHRAALDLLSARMQRAGLMVTLDDAGTLVGRLEGEPGRGTLMMGSHQDSVREGGAYDGILGVVLPILALEKLREEGVAVPVSVEVLAFADEEGVRFPTALVGSRALAGTVDPAVLNMEDAGGTSLRNAITGFGLSPDRIGALKRNRQDVIGFIETHIEQGPVLEREAEALGVVSAICGIERHRIALTGEMGHAGTLPMEGRRDALVGAAAIITEVNRIANATPDLRATVGALAIEPNVVNAVPRAARLTAEFRSSHDETRRTAGDHLHAFARQVADDIGLGLDCERTYQQPVQPCSPDLSKRLVNAVKQAGGKGLVLPSGATHDASAMADLCPVAMLFVRCRDGVSHKPEEYAAPKDLGRAVEVLAAVLESMTWA
ncbi:MAG: M20 family metallo-hydrolase [Sediminimonas sp.]|uniref:M20 family metallo-hydrolase n=1 Tax=Sediminimonas sp. TaxID=2823379 RepID=UPI00286FFEAE|nr:M20 family metallo-hydrolase [Sediminimonas sp.]MDR9486055.1 M20 family metallo-hydrolase [Sediminimonas sp.]